MERKWSTKSKQEITQSLPKDSSVGQNSKKSNIASYQNSLPQQMIPILEAPNEEEKLPFEVEEHQHDQVTLERTDTGDSQITMKFKNRFS